MSSPAFAFVEDNAEQRINFSGKLRMLSQRIPSAACHLAHGIDPEGAMALLNAAPAEFEKILAALEFGDPELDIQQPETKRQALVRIHTLRERWEPLKEAADRLANGTGSQQDVDRILQDNMKVLEAAVGLVSELVRLYSNPNAVPYANLLLVDISGRQRMLTQKMSKESCIMGSAHRSAETLESLQGTMQIFEMSLQALRNGLDEVGIKPPPNETIESGLEVVLDDWNSVKPMLEEILSGGELDSDKAAAKFQKLNVTMANMNKVVGMYAEAAKSPY